MPVTRRLLTACSALGLAGLAAATCDQSPSPTAPLPTNPGVGQFRLELRGPITVPPDGTAQFSLIIIEADGATRDVSAEAQWHVTNPAVLTVSATGLVTGRNRGEAVLGASINGFGANRPVMVIPDGTFRLSGTITDAGSPVADARLEVASGTGRGLATTSDSSGQYKLYGVAGDTVIRISKSGYRTLDHRIAVTTHQRLDLQLPLAGTLPNVAGSYTLTVTASGSCSMLSDDVKRRSYTAVVTQNGGAVEVTLSGANFLVFSNTRSDQFRGRFEPGGLVLKLRPYGDDEVLLLRRPVLRCRRKALRRISRSRRNGGRVCDIPRDVRPAARRLSGLLACSPVRCGHKMRRYFHGPSIRILAVAAAAAGLAGAVHVTRPVERPITGVVVITLDTTRADRLSVYGFMDVSMPHLERLAREGVVFDRAVTPAPLTLPAHASLFTGLYPHHHGVRDNADRPLAARFTTLAETLRSHGFHTSAFVGSVVLASDRGLSQGFGTYGDVPAGIPDTPGPRQRRADTVIGDAIEWLEEIDRAPFFLWAHLYRPPPAVPIRRSRSARVIWIRMSGRLLTRTPSSAG